MPDVDRDVILDLVPLVLAGEASAATRALVDEHLARDPELATRVRLLAAEGFAPPAGSTLPPELELLALRRARRAIAVQRWLFALGVACTAIGLALRVTSQPGRWPVVQLLALEQPWPFAAVFGVGVVLLAAYATSRGRGRPPR